MTVEDFVFVMKQNIAIYPYSDEELRQAAILNIHTGVAETYLEDGEVVGVGGIRYMGIGEGWFISLPQKRTPAMLRVIAKQFARIRKAKNIWRIFAESKISENFLRHLGFAKQDGIHIWTSADNRREEA
jgi:hypothetical protein